MVAPRPTPRIAMKTPTATRLVVSSMVPSRLETDDDQHHAADQEALPQTGLADDPAADDAGDDRPPTMAIDIRPAWVGLMPRATWKYWLR